MSSSSTESTPTQPSAALRVLGFSAALVGLTLLAALRRPAALTEPTIWAEDGAVFMAVAWQGPGQLLEPYAGQAWILQRLLALAIGTLPATWWPIAIYLVGCLGIALVAVIPLMRRGRGLFGPLPYRWLLALLIVLLPGAFEVQGNITNLHWWAIGGLWMIAAMPAPDSRGGKIAELVVFALLGLTGPVALFVLPLAMWRWIRGPRTSRYLIARVGVLVAASLVAAFAAIGGGRAEGNDVSWIDLPAYLYVKWGGSLALGETVLASEELGPSDALLLLGAVIMVALLLLAVTDLRGPSWLWLAGGVVAAVLGALIGMRSGTGADLLEPRNVTRYAVPLLLASILVLVRGLANASLTWLRVVAAGALALTFVGVIADARVPPAGAPVARSQLADLRPCFEGQRQFSDAVACTVDIAPEGWQLVVFRPGYESLRDVFKEQLSERQNSSRAEPSRL